MIFTFKGSSRLKQEIQSWVDEKLITPEQGEQLFARYELSKDAPWYLRSGFILKGLALLLGGMGFLLLISQNWERFGTPLQMAIGLVPLLATYAIGFRFLKRGLPEQAELAFFLASILFGMNIFLQAQIFHISSYFPDGVLWWIIGALPVALYFRSALHHLLVQALYYIWLLQQLEFHQFSFWAVLLFAALLYLLRQKPSKTVFLATIANSYAFVFNLNTAVTGREFQGFWLLAIAATLVIVLAIHFFRHQYDEKFIERLHTLGVWVITFIFYLHTFGDLTEFYVGNEISPVSLGLLALVGVLFYYTDKSLVNIMIITIAGVVLILQIAGAYYQGDKRDFGDIAFIVNNLLFFAYALWNVRYGINHQIKRHFMTGIFLIVALAVTRYLDLFEDYMLSAIIFMLSGLFLYLIHNYWDKRYAE